MRYITETEVLMLGERDYMRRMKEPEQTAASGSMCLLILIAVNVVIWMLGRPFAGHLVLTPEAVRHFELWRFITAAFTHFDFWHLFFNMFGLWMFGSLSAPTLGWKNFLNLYLISGVFGNVLWYVFNIDTPAALLGASGAVVGVIMATAMIMPNLRVLLLFFPVPVKLKTMAIVYIVLEVVQQGANIQSNIAYLVHIGGFFAGFLFMHLFLSREIVWSPLDLLLGKQRPVSPRMEEFRRAQRPHKPPRGWTVSSYRNYTGGAVSPEEIDRILDKLSRTGINSLSEEEMEILRKAREQMKSPK